MVVERVGVVVVVEAGIGIGARVLVVDNGGVTNKAENVFL